MCLNDTNKGMILKKKHKSAIRDLLYGTLYHSGFNGLFQALRGRRRGIICYHNVLPVASLEPVGRYQVDVTRDVMAAHLRLLTKKFTILPIAEMEDPRARGLFLHFDDGMLNNHTTVLPLLEDFKLTALFAVCPAFVNKEIPHIWRDHFYLILRKFIGKSVFLPMDDYGHGLSVSDHNLLTLESDFKKWLYANRVSDIYAVIRAICDRNRIAYTVEDLDPLRFRFMDWTQVRDLQQRGHVIASHTHTHRVMKFLSLEEKLAEFSESKAVLEQNLPTTIRHIVYPYGGPDEIDAETVVAARQAGYQAGYINVGQPYLGNTPLAVPRFSLPCSRKSPHLYAVASGLDAVLKGKW